MHARSSSELSHCSQDQVYGASAAARTRSASIQSCLGND